MPQISVIVPVFNTAEYIDTCIKSIINQTFKDFELIIINDGSTDESLSHIQKFSKSDNRIKLICQENKGLSEARNAGIRASNSDWITFIDSDDAVAPTFLEDMFALANQKQVPLVCCNKFTFTDGCDISNYLVKKNNLQKTFVMSFDKALENALYQKDKPDYSAWNKMYSIQLWKNRVFPKGKFFEDMATIPSVIFDAKKIAFINKPLYLYRMRKSGILATKYNLEKAELLNIAEELYQFILNNVPHLKKAAASNLFSASCSILMRTTPTEDFFKFRNDAFLWIMKLRLQILFDSRTRWRNKIAALLSYAPKSIFLRVMRIK